ncbi:MAG TPA: DUF309 domain-containing protein [Verrucomicrobiae bacterium]|nr:DUF309 domain-containing protein [Verrucomicrobiae bacterium]
MSTKGKRIAAMAGQFYAGALDPHYSGYFELFNQQKFYEAHDVLEHLWLKDKYGANGAFYKGLIQLAGAFVHLQKHRPRPAAALFKLARTNLEKYPHRHQDLNLATALELIREWLGDLENSNFERNPLLHRPVPKLNPHV